MQRTSSGSTNSEMVVDASPVNVVSTAGVAAVVVGAVVGAVVELGTAGEEEDGGAETTSGTCEGSIAAAFSSGAGVVALGSRKPGTG